MMKTQQKLRMRKNYLLYVFVVWCNLYMWCLNLRSVKLNYYFAGTHKGLVGGKFHMVYSYVLKKEYFREKKSVSCIH